MPTYDLIIRGGLIVDGTGRDPFHADVAIKDGTIMALGRVEGHAAEEIDASGKLVTPGFIDIHTHYDGQAIWAEHLQPSSSHGVTTVVLGNCGVGFAPCAADDHDTLITVMEGVEDIPGVVMAEGLSWDWESFPDFLDALDRRRRDIDLGVYLPHSPLRIYAMGKRGAAREAATDEDLERMRALTAEAIDAGALGFATSRVHVHRTGEGEHIPSYQAAERELFAIGDVLREKGRGLMQIAPDLENLLGEVDLYGRLARATGRPVTFSLGQTNNQPDVWRAVLDALSQINDGTAEVTAQVFPRPVGMILGLETTVNPFSLCPTYANVLEALSLGEKVARMRDPGVRAALLAEKPADPNTPIYAMGRDFARIFRLNSVGDYEPHPMTSILALANAAGREPLEFVYDLLLEQDGKALLYSAIGNYAQLTLEPVGDMMADPNTRLGLGDGGAHYGVICDSSYPTFFLSHWTRDRSGRQFSIPEAIKQLSLDNARTMGLLDRGQVAVGSKADLNVIDYNRLTLGIPYTVDDLPGGGRRLTQDADGYVATIVSGTIVMRDGKATGALPGKLVRGAQPARVPQAA